MSGLSARVNPVTIRLRSNFWIHWTRIAIEHAVQARRHRNRARTPKGVDAEAFGDELRAAMVAITAAAFALEALAIEFMAVSPIPGIAWKDLAGQSGRPTRGQWVMQVLRAELTVPASLNGRVGLQVPKLFEARDDAVHFVAEAHDAVPHPAGGSSARENKAYSVEPADKGVRFVLELLAHAVAPGSAKTEQLARWADGHRHAVDELRAIHAAEQGQD